jgi:ribosomal protein L11 methyltransferase
MVDRREATEEGLLWTGVEIAMPDDVEDDDDRLDVLSSALFEVGAGGLETKDDARPIRVIASFSPENTGDDLIERVEAALEASSIAGARLSVSLYDPIDWSTHWRRHFTTKAFGAGDKTIWVAPTWLEAPEGAERVLRIDPSSAFGTGLHPTTAMCIEKIAEISPLDRILDIGTGTGILALAALELGAESAVATDNDPEALRVAKENADLNGLGAKLELSDRDPRALGRRFPAIVANILARPLIDLAPEIAAAAEDGSLLILSGITISQASDVISAYEAEGFSKLHLETREEWARVDLVKERR